MAVARPEWTDLRLVADDLTGALDSAAAFAPVFGPVRVVWNEAMEPHGPAAFDTRTREASPEIATARLTDLRGFLQPEPGRLSLLKVDSLLRGKAGREILAVSEGFDTVLIAPAFPFQGRAARQGRQAIRDGDNWRVIGEDIVATLRDAGLAVSIRDPGEAAPAGVSFWNAATDADLDAVVDAGSARAGRCLWVGSAGLAAALARRMAMRSGQLTLPALPLLGLVGTDNPAMLGQLERVAGQRIVIGNEPLLALRDILDRIQSDGAAFLTCDLPQGLPREAMQAAIAGRFAEVCARLERPGALFVSGGETLSALCRALGASGLDVYGQFEPGAPLSRLCGGDWDGLDIVSKSGAFGTPDFLQRLLAGLANTRKVGVP